MIVRYLIIIACIVLQLHSDDLQKSLEDAKWYGYLKTMYVYDDRVYPKIDQSTFGIGGKIGFMSGSFEGFKAKAAYYVTDDLGTRSTNPKKTDAYMFDVDKKPYSVLGEALIEYTNSNHTFLLGRQEIDTPIVSTYDYRIIPNLFEAYTYNNTAYPDISLTFSYITKMSGLDGLVSFKNFKSMSQQTYTSLSMIDYQIVDSNDGETVDISKISGDQGVIMTGLVYDNGLRTQIWNYYCQDVINEFYADIAYPHPLDEQWKLLFEAQGYGVRTLGKFDRFLDSFGLNGAYELYGAKITLSDPVSGISTYIAYNFFTGDDKTVTAFGNWGGYPEYVAVPYMFAQDLSVSAIAKSQMRKINFKWDLSKIGLDNQSLVAGYSRIDLNEHIMPNSDIDVVNLVYKAKVSEIILRAQYEWRDSNNYRYANDMLTLSATYKF